MRVYNRLQHNVNVICMFINDTVCIISSNKIQGENLMLQFVQKNSHTALMEYQSISNLIHQQKFVLAANEIRQLEDGTFADRIISEMLKKKSPECWLALLRNRFLNHALWSNHLIAMVQDAQKAIRFGADVAILKPEYRQITTAIAQNPKWCEMLSYSFFIRHVEFDEELRKFVINSEDFIRNLEPFHVDALVRAAPKDVAEILLCVAMYLEGNEMDVLWAQETLKWLLFKNPIAAACLSDVSFDPLYEYILSICEMPQSSESTSMAVDDVEEPIYSTPMEIDGPWGFPEELSPLKDDWVAKLEATLGQPPAQQETILRAPLPVRITQAAPHLLEQDVATRTNPLRRTFSN